MGCFISRCMEDKADKAATADPAAAPDQAERGEATKGVRGSNETIEVLLERKQSRIIARELTADKLRTFFNFTHRASGKFVARWALSQFFSDSPCIVRCCSIRGRPIEH